MTVPTYTDAYTDLCFVGPLGALEPLPDVASSQGVKVGLSRIGGTHRALAGGLTVDTFARKRTWTWTYDMLMDRQLPYVEALQWGHIKGPLRLIDPRRYNRLPESIATCGTTGGSASEVFTTDNNSAAYWTSLRNVPGDLSTLGPRRVLSGATEWQIITPDPNENGIAGRDWRYADQNWRTPILPNETLEGSAWCLYPQSAQIMVGLSWRADDGSFIDSSVCELTQGGGEEWVRLSVTASAPDGAVAALPFLSSSAPYLPTATSIYTTAWQIASPTLARLIPPGVTEHCDVPEIASEWRQGGGGPFVVPDVSDMAYSQPGFYGTALTLMES
jgi:hypothetical protein